MKTLLCATLAALLVAAVTAQSSQQSDDASSIQGIIDKLNNVVSSLGGFEGTINKLEYITKLVEKAYTDQGIGGWMARNLIKLELNQLKEKAMSTEKDMINHLLDQLEAKAGLRTYSADPSEEYILSGAVKNAIALIRESIQQILAEISKAQKEHDEAAGKIGKDALNKVTERLNGLKDKLRGLTKKLLDKLTGRDKTVEVYGADGGIRYFNTQVSGENYIFSEMIKIAAQQIRERIFKYIELIGEAKREAEKAFGKHKEEALQHLERLKERLRQSMAELKDTLLGRKTNDELEEETKEEVDDSYSILIMNSENYILDGIVKDLIGKLREKIVEVIEKLGKAKREAERAAGEGKKAARENLAKLREQLRRLTKDLKDAVLGRKTKEELEKDLEEEQTVELLSNSRVEDLVREIREKIIKAVEALGKARERAGELAGDSIEEMAKTREQLRKLTEEMKEALRNRMGGDQTENELEADNSAYALQYMNSENYILNKELLAKLQERIKQLTEELKKAGQEVLKATGEAKDVAKARFRQLQQQLNKFTKNLMDAILGRKSADELEKDLEEEPTVQLWSNSRVEDLVREIREKIIKAVEALGKARERAGELAGDSKEELDKAREQLRKLTEEMKEALLGREDGDQIREKRETDNSAYALQYLSSDNYILEKELLARLRERIQQLTEELKKVGQQVLAATGEAKDVARARFRQLQQRLNKMSKDLMDALLGRKTTNELEEELDEPL